jgi:hypothetical protein
MDIQSDTEYWSLGARTSTKQPTDMTEGKRGVMGMKTKKEYRKVGYVLKNKNK